MKELLQIQAELKAPKNQFNSFGKYKYRNAEDILEAVKGIKSNGMDAWKPEKSLFATREEIKLVQNTLEASVIVKMNRQINNY